MTEPKLSDKQRDEPFLPGTYGWIEQAVEFMQAFKPENFDPDLNRLRDDLLSGVPCPPKDLGFNSPADRRARRLLAAWNAATLPELQALPTSIAPYFVHTGYTHVICRCDRCKAEGPAPAEGPTLEGADLIARLRGAPKEGNTLLHLEAANWIETLERENLELRHEG